MLRQRILTALWLLPLMLGMLFWVNAAVWGLFVGAITLVAVWEFCSMTDWQRSTRRHYLLGTAFFMLTAWAADWVLPDFIWLMVLIFWLIIMPMWLRKKWQLTGFSAMATGWMIFLPFWFAMVTYRPEDDSVAPFLAILALVWIADTGAYFVGRALGKRKLAPVISPKKSWEGAFGGWLIVIIYMMILNQYDVLPEMGWFGLIFPSSVLVAVSIGGDLLESWFKRAKGIKDSGKLLPGHGGVYDRIDSLVAVMAVFAAMLEWL